MLDIIKEEPVAVFNAIAGVIEAGLVLAIAFGLDVSPEQLAAITTVIVSVGQTMATILGRARVSPTRI